jgi:hypothetical protein
MHRHTHGTVGSLTPISGGIIGNKRTHVYHLPGDTGNLPAAKNRVYFHNEAEARAAGYHPAGKHASGPKTTHHKTASPPTTAPPPPPK